MSLSIVLKSGFLDKLFIQATPIIKRDRDQYAAVWTTIEKYCIDNKLIVSDLYVLADESKTLPSLFNKCYKIYTPMAFRHANNLTNLIHQSIEQPTKLTTKLKTIQEKQEFVIEYDTRQVAIIYQLQRHRSVELGTLIKPVEYNNMLYLPAEIELIDVYHKLYDPSQASNFDESLRFEDHLYKQIETRKSKGMLGGDPVVTLSDSTTLSDVANNTNDIEPIGGAQNCHERKKDMVEAVKVSIIKDWLTKKRNTILVGSWAYDWIKLGSEICMNMEKIQIISEMAPEELLEELQQYISEITRTTITMKEQDLHIPKDFRTRRYTYYIQIHSERGTTEKAFLDLFNCANFEVVPYIDINNIFVGSKWIILRFLLIDLWIIKLIKALGLLTADVLAIKINHIWKLIDFFRNEYKNETPADYIGIHRDYMIDKKINNIQGKAYYPYFPESYFRNHSTYRQI